MHKGSAHRWASAKAWVPAPPAIDRAERLRVVTGVLAGLLAAAAVAGWLGASPGWPVLMAPLGASAVLVFALPASPLAQPWPVLVGNTVSAAVGAAVAQWVPLPMLAAAPLAAALAVAAMLATRSLHPPGGAVALLAVTVGADLRFVALPVFANTAVLLLAAVVYNRSSGRRYPHAPAAAPAAAARQDPATGVVRFSEADLQEVIERRNRLVDVPTDELRELLESAEQQAHGRRLRQWRCADIMTPGPQTLSPGVPVDDAMARMQALEMGALPVVDAAERLVGIVTRADCLAEVVSRTGAARAQTQPQGVRVRDIMSRRVRVASSQLSLADLLPEFAAGGHHHLPVLDEQQRLVGIVTQTDVLRALLRDEHPAAWQRDASAAPRPGGGSESR